MNKWIGIFLLVIIVGMYLYYNPQVLSKLSILSESINQRPSYESNCLNVINEKIDVINQKYSPMVYLYILKFQSFDNRDDAKQFWKTWSVSQLPNQPVNSDIDSLNLPLTIVVVKNEIKVTEGATGTWPETIVCSNGTIGSNSLKQFMF